MGLPDDIDVLRLPSPFAVGDVNCYVLAGDPLTVVDPGPHMQSTRESLDSGLAELGHEIGEIDRIILTHQHHDHVGLAAEVARKADAELCAIDPLAEFLADFERSMEHDDRYALETMVRSGIERQVAISLRTMSAAFRVFGRGADVDRRLQPGDVIEAGERRLEVLFRPGHSPTDTIFLDADSGLLLGGDHLLEKISSNPIAHAPIGIDDPEAAARSPDRPQPLLRYVESMRATREHEISLVLPGHGEEFADAKGLIDQRLGFHRRRAEKIRTALERPMTASEIAASLWTRLPVAQTYLALSEVIGHLDMLIAAGEVEPIEDGEIARYRPA